MLLLDSFGSVVAPGANGGAVFSSGLGDSVTATPGTHFWEARRLFDEKVESKGRARSLVKMGFLRKNVASLLLHGACEL
jgi:hypothetical protein